MNWILISPVLWPFLAAGISWLLGRRSREIRDIFVPLACCIQLILSAALALWAPDGLQLQLPKLCGPGLSFTLDGFRRLYLVVTAFLWVGTSLFSGEYFAHYHRRNRYYLFNLLTLGACAAVFLSADLITTLVFFEIMSFTSYTWVAHDQTAPSLRAAETYLAVAVIGGMAALMGLFLLQHSLGTLVIDDLEAAAAHAPKATLYAASLCLLVGFGAKAGMFPLHIWLPKAHPVAPAPASALLSGLLTKTGIFGIVILSCRLLREDTLWGTIILSLGTVTMVLGAVLALFSVDLKRTLACSSMSQMGFILVGIGAICLLGHHNAIAAQGVVLHMLNHSLFKLVLFLCAGAVYQNLHQLQLNDIRGFGRKKPILHISYLMGALGIGGIPLWSGYISKTLLHEALVELGHAYAAVEWLFLFSGGLTLAYMTKLYVCLFWQKHPLRQQEFDAMGHGMCRKSAAALLSAALLIPFFGVSGLMDRIAHMSCSFLTHHHLEHTVHYFTWTNLKGAVISCVIAAVIYVIAVRKWMMDGHAYIDRWPAKLDLEDLLYRPLVRAFHHFGHVLEAAGQLAEAAICAAMTAVRLFLHGICDIPDAMVALCSRWFLAPTREHLSTRRRRSHAWQAGHHLDELNAHLHRNSHLAQQLYRISVTLRDVTMRITGSLSFSLLMACLGICFLMFYLLSRFL